MNVCTPVLNLQLQQKVLASQPLAPSTIIKKISRDIGCRIIVQRICTHTIDLKVFAIH